MSRELVCAMICQENLTLFLFVVAVVLFCFAFVQLYSNAGYLVALLRHAVAGSVFLQRFSESVLLNCDELIGISSIL